MGVAAFALTGWSAYDEADIDLFSLTDDFEDGAVFPGGKVDAIQVDVFRREPCLIFRTDFFNAVNPEDKRAAVADGEGDGKVNRRREFHGEIEDSGALVAKCAIDWNQIVCGVNNRIFSAIGAFGESVFVKTDDVQACTEVEMVVADGGGHVGELALLDETAVRAAVQFHLRNCVEILPIGAIDLPWDGGGETERVVAIGECRMDKLFVCN